MMTDVNSINDPHLKPIRTDCEKKLVQEVLIALLRRAPTFQDGMHTELISAKYVRNMKELHYQGVLLGMIIWYNQWHSDAENRVERLKYGVRFEPAPMFR